MCVARWCGHACSQSRRRVDPKRRRARKRIFFSFLRGERGGAGCVGRKIKKKKNGEPSEQRTRGRPSSADVNTALASRRAFHGRRRPTPPRLVNTARRLARLRRTVDAPSPPDAKQPARSLHSACVYPLSITLFTPYYCVRNKAPLCKVSSRDFRSPFSISPFYFCT